jgi:DNA primase catalytic subunit
MENNNKRRLSNRYRLANIRRRLWRDEPDRMESIRQKAIKQSKLNRDIESIQLADFISFWDKSLTTKQLNELIKSQIHLTKSTVKNFKKYLVRRRLMRFDAEQGIWINLTHLQSDGIDV